MKNLYVVLCVLPALAACKWGKPGKQEHDINTDTLAFQYKNLVQRAADCGNKPDSACTVVQILYPLFKTEAALNDTILQRITALSIVNKNADTVLKQFAGQFLKAYYKDKGSISRHIYYQMQQSVKVIRQDSAITTLQLSSYRFTGGAHGMSMTTFINWSPRSHTNIYLKDILINGYAQPLTRIAEKIFRQQEHLADTASLKNNYFFKDNKFSLNNNFLITPTGLRFLYNQYEIKPYAAGQTELVIPYAQIKPLLRPNTVISQYHL